MGARLKYNVYRSLVLIYVVTLTSKWKFHFLPNILEYYLADLLALPLILKSSLFLTQKLKKDPSLQLSKTKIIVTVIYVSLVFELILPHFNSKYTSDSFDVLCYIIGGFIFYFLETKKAPEGALQRLGN